MFVVLSGTVAITQRDGLGHVTPVIDQGPGQFLAEIGQLSGRVALVDGHAEGDVETLLIPPDRLRALLVAEAELGERIMRALILRRVSLIQGGVGGPVLIGPASLGDMARLQNFLARNGQPHHLLDPATDKDAADLVARYVAARADLPLVVCPDGTVLRNPTEAELALRDRHDRRRTTMNKLYDVAVVGSGPAGLADRRLCGLRRTVGRRVRRARVRRPGRRQRAGSRTIWAFRPAFPGQALAGRAFNQAQKFGADMLIPVVDRVARLQPRRWRLCAGDSNAARVLRAQVRRGRERRALSAARDRKSRPTSRAAASGTGPRRSRRGCAPARRSCWSAAAIPPARPRCSCPAMRARST